jgi:hypothetical protein
LTAGEDEREPVFADLLGMGVHRVEAALPGELVGWLVVMAEGYEPFRVGLRWHVESSRTMEPPVRLRPVEAGVQAQSLAEADCGSNVSG